MREIPASTFKAECLRILDSVAATGEEIIVTKRGKPVARLGPAEPAEGLSGSITFRVTPDELIKPIEEGWDAER